MSKCKSESKKRRYKRAALIKEHKEYSFGAIEYYYEIHNLPKGDLFISDENISLNTNNSSFTIKNRLNEDLFLCELFFHPGIDITSITMNDDKTIALLSRLEEKPRFAKKLSRWSLPVAF